MSEAWPLLLLWLSGFTSATILPGNSEAALLLYLQQENAQPWLALAFVSCGNLLGGLATFVLGRLAPVAPDNRWLQRVRRFGPPLTLLSPLPLVGDLIVAAAGWLRLSLWQVTLWMLLARTGRYLLLMPLGA